MRCVTSPRGAPIVLVEDDSTDAYFVRYALDAAHIVNPLVRFESARQARDYFATAFSLPLLFVMDVHLAGDETGLDLLRWLRQQPPPLGSTPVMMLTGSDRPDDREAAEQLGAIHFLRKPVVEATLSTAVQSLGFVITSMAGFSTQRTIERRL
jgi:CheY-like chemotaxis protein